MPGATVSITDAAASSQEDSIPSVSIVKLSCVGPQFYAQRARSTISSAERRGQDQSWGDAAGLGIDAGAGAGGGGAASGGGGASTALGAGCAASATGAGAAATGANAARRVAPTRAVKLPGVATSAF